MTRVRAARWLAVAISLGQVACAPDREAARKGLPITAAERALAQAAWDMDLVDGEPADPCGVGGTGLDFGPWLDEREQRATLATLIASNDPARLASLGTALQRERQVAMLSALLDHPALEVRRAAVQGLRNLRDRRGVSALLAAAKHNAFALDSAAEPGASALSSAPTPSPSSAPAAAIAPSAAASAPASSAAADSGRDDETLRAARQAYRKDLASALQHITRIKPYEGPAQRRGGPPKIWTFDFGRLDLWLENEVLRARRWSE
jgi:hypothetical protein